MTAAIFVLCCQQISLVQFFIENFEKIFEGNTNIHLGQGSVMPSNGKESLDTFIGLREMDAVQDDEKTCASETRHSSGDTEPRHPPAAPHEGECSVEWSSNSDNENQG